MFTFATTLCIPHWVFFYTYFECCTTMPYFYLQTKVPRWMKYGLKGLNVVMIASQIVGPFMIFYYAQRANMFYYGAFSDPNFNPFKFDFSQGDVLAAKEKFWLNFLVGT